MKDRLAFKFYRSYFDVAKELPEKERLEFLWALLNKQFENTDTELTGLAKFAYISQEHSIKAQVQGYLDKINSTTEGGTKGGSKGGTKAPSIQEKEKEKEKVKEKVIDINIRKQTFASSLQPYLEKYGREFLNEFYLYWTEQSVTNKKLKFELEKTWSLERRLYTWKNNAIKFGTTLPKDQQNKFKAPWE